MAIINGQLANADEVMNAMASNFVDNAQLLFNADYIGFDSKLNDDGVPQLKNVDYDTFTSDNMTKSNVTYNSTDDVYEFLKVDDEINNSDYSAHWTASTTEGGEVIEDASKLLIRADYSGDVGTATAISNGATPLDYYNSNNDSMIRLRVNITVTSLAGGDAAGYIGLTDGTNTVWFKSIVNPGAETSDDSVWEVYINSAANTIDVYDDGVLDTSGIDISSLSGGNYYIKAYAKQTKDQSADGAFVEIYYVYSREVNDVMSITSPVETSPATITNAIGVLNKQNATNVSIELSADNGSNYESATENTIYRFTNTGTQLFFRATETVGSITVPETIPTVSEYAVKYNLY